VYNTIKNRHKKGEPRIQDRALPYNTYRSEANHSELVIIHVGVEFSLGGEICDLLLRCLSLCSSRTTQSRSMGGGTARRLAGRSEVSHLARVAPRRVAGIILTAIHDGDDDDE